MKKIFIVGVAVAFALCGVVSMGGKVLAQEIGPGPHGIIRVAQEMGPGPLGVDSIV